MAAQLADECGVVAGAFTAASDALVDCGAGQWRGAQVAVLRDRSEQRYACGGAGHSPAAHMLVERVLAAEQSDDGGASARVEC